MTVLRRCRLAPRCALLLLAFSGLCGCATGPLADPRTEPGRTAAEPYREPGDGVLRRPEDLPLALRELGNRDPWTLTLTGSTGYILGGDDGLDAFTNGVSAALTHRFHIASTLTVTLAYSRRDYDFDADRGLLAGLGHAPGQLHTIGATVSLFQPLSEEWAVFLSAGTAASTEVGVDPLEDPSFVGIAVLGHQVTPKLQLGLGVLAAARPEEDAVFVPIPHIDWQIDDRWRFATEETGGGFHYQASEALELSGLVTFDTRRYRLDERGPGAAGIFEDSRTSLALRADWEPSDDVRMTLLGGLDVLRYLEIADADGRVLADEEAGVGGFVRFTLSVAF